ncbi:MAG: carbohydrate binding domain-containing protein [bacterium]
MSILQKIRGINFRKHLSCIILIWTFSLVVFPNVYSQEKPRGKNLIINPGFEEGNNGWGFKQAEVVSSDAHTGKYCVRVAGGDYNAAFQDIAVEKGKKYRFSVYVKVPSGENVFWVVVISDSQEWIKGTYRQGKAILPSWTKIEQLYPYQPITFTANESTVRVSLWNRKGSSEDASVYFDDIVLELVNEEVSVNTSNNEIKVVSQEKLQISNNKGLSSLVKPKALIFPKDSIQYFFSPFRPSKEGINDYNLIFEVPQGFILQKDMFNTIWNWTGGTQFKVPKNIVMEKIRRNGIDYDKYILPFQLSSQGSIRIRKDTKYKISCMAKGNLEGGNIALYVRWGRADGGYIEYVPAILFEGAFGWKKFEKVLTPPGGAEMIGIWVIKWESSQAKGTLWVDDIKLYDEAKSKDNLVENGNFEDLENIENNWPGLTNGGNIRLVNEPKESQGQNHCLMMKADKALLGKRQTISHTIPEPFHIGPTIATATFFKLTGEMGKEYKIYYHWETADKSMSESEKEINITLDDNTSPKTPKHIETAMWLAEGPFGGCGGKMQNTLTAIFKNTGINTCYTETIDPYQLVNDVNDDIATINVKLPFMNKLKGFKNIGYLYYTYNSMGPFNLNYTEKHPEFWSVAFNGAKSKDHRICLTHILKDGAENNPFWKMFLALTEKLIIENNLDGVYWDYEQGMPMPDIKTLNNFSSPQSGACFCDRCIAEFKKFAHIEDLEKQPSKKIIIEDYPYDKLKEPVRSLIKNYPLEWTKFKCWQDSELWRMLRDSVKKANPNASFRIYTGPYKDGYWTYYDRGILRSSEHYGVSWPMAGKYIDVAMGCHNPGFYSRVEAVLLKEAVKSQRQDDIDIPVILDVTLAGNMATYGTEDDVKIRILNTVALCGAKGVGIWGLWKMDSSYYARVREAISVIADFEDFFLKGRQCDFLASVNKTYPELKMTVWLKGEKRLVFLFNESADEKRITLTNLYLGPQPSDRIIASDYDTKEVYPNPEIIKITIPPKDVKIILINNRIL